jgi:hypothetical protein
LGERNASDELQRKLVFCAAALPRALCSVGAPAAGCCLLLWFAAAKLPLCFISASALQERDRRLSARDGLVGELGTRRNLLGV